MEKDLIRPTIYNIDLSKQLQRIFSGVLLAKNDKQANRMGVNVYQDGQAVSLSGYTVKGYFIRSGVETLILTGAIDGNTAYVDLDAKCYHKDGSYTLSIVLCKDGQEQTLVIYDGKIAETNTDTVVENENTLSLADIAQQEWVTNVLNAADTALEQAGKAEAAAAEAQAIKDSIPADYTELTKNVSKLSEEIENQKSLIENVSEEADRANRKNNNVLIESDNILDETTQQSGYIGLNGVVSSPSDTYKYYADFIEVEEGHTYYCTANARFITAYDSEKKPIESAGATNASTYTVPTGVKFIRLSYLSSYTGVWFAKTQLSAYKPMQYFIKPDAVKNFGETPFMYSLGSIIGGRNYNMNGYPTTLKKNVGMSFYGKFDTFGTYFAIGKGLNTYGGKWLTITTESINFTKYFTTAETISVDHGLTIEDYININWFTDSKTCTVILTTKNGSFRTTFDWLGDQNGVPFFGGDTAMSNVKATISCADLSKSLWAFGDSYYGYAYPNRVMYNLREMNFDNFAVFGFGGETASEAFADLRLALNYGTPKFLVWSMGMNGDDETSIEVMNTLISLCNEKGIELILYKVPAVPNLLHETLNAAVVASGKRYIDAYAAVGCDGLGNWYSGYLDTDNVHPTSLGAKAIAMRMLLDAPEIMLYK